MGTLSFGGRSVTLSRRLVREMVRLHGISCVFTRGGETFSVNMLLSTRPQNFIEGLSWATIETLSSEALFGVLPIFEEETEGGSIEIVQFIPVAGDRVVLSYQGLVREYEVFRVGHQTFPEAVFYKVYLNPFYKDTNVPDNFPLDDDLQVGAGGPNAPDPVYDDDIYGY